MFMKFRLLLFSLIITISTKGQEVFSDAFASQFPFALLTIEEQLYVSTIAAGNDELEGVFRVNFNNPNNFELVSEFPNVGFGLLYMRYDSGTNSIYGILINEIIRIDLNFSLPITFETILSGMGDMIDLNGGLVVNNGFIYYRNFTQNAIQRIAVTGGNPETIFTLNNDDPFILGDIFENQLYYSRVSDATGSDLYRIDLSNPAETLVADLEGFPDFLQSSYLNGSRLFLSFEPSDRIFSFDLSQALPIEPELVLDNINGNNAALGIASESNDLYYTNGSGNIFRLQDILLNTSEFENVDFEVFPNPSTDHIFIITKNQKSVQYEVFDILGKRILNGNYNDIGIDLSHLNNGMYFVTITTNDGITSTQKIIKN